jgi:hypothetical protein
MTDIAGLCESLRAPKPGVLMDITGRLHPKDRANPDGPQAADTLERQAAEIERLREALEPIAARPVPDGCTDNALIGWISAGAIRKARAALTGEDT